MKSNGIQKDTRGTKYLNSKRSLPLIGKAINAWIMHQLLRVFIPGVPRVHKKIVTIFKDFLMTTFINAHSWCKLTGL